MSSTVKSNRATPPDLISGGLSPANAAWLAAQQPKNKKRRTERDRLCEAFIRGLQVGADDPTLAGDGRDMYEAFKRYMDGPHE